MEKEEAKSIPEANFSVNELCEIYENLLECNWDNRLGEKPIGFDDAPICYLPTKKKWWQKKEKETITKRSILFPYMIAIREKIPEKQMYRLQLKRRGFSDEDFELWWRTKYIPEFNFRIY